MVLASTPSTVVRALLRAGIWMCWSGFGSKTAHGMRGRVRSAAGGGHLEVLKWAREHGFLGGGHRGLGQRLLCTRRYGRAFGGA